MFEQYNNVQQAVLETTLDLIIDRELQATSMSLIAKNSGVSTGNIYHYFSSKEDIINELYKAIVRFNGEFVTKNINETDSIQKQFRNAWRNLIELGNKYPKGFRFIEQYSFSPYIYEQSKLEAYKDGWCGPLEKMYQKAVEEGLFVQLEPQIMVQMHYGSIVYLLKANQQNLIELTDDIVDKAILACWNAVSRQGQTFI
ncbi:TetR/AcrR family transcriptional regulator [Paenibacillus alvei]|uniref:TetR/AcrR family transcriptional regulator n=1 Tax=Paenibacillus alvei TaxID=44250 RepID=A0ABT4GUH8_PAEAL|nr:MULTISPECIES: TetR/AcrR family transcriptional regulator [Paenibacillus]EJW17811.1 transcriptional regulator, TetR family [Paenibacillus alvei DSM 29]MCY7483242.1 TetR/AcrR family transcriptional regulator [Paenibacillus alvei]MCY9544211.1 TetR/AcrR family transcriptional regulator [Paenibacillus alvei]MCY9708099.1 TetR/AcrR family transcriptional regulator [Paenibacillus alvei]MCY9737394.1 TetR/AcrR family transcriptional regulator [Paenibacillus alvei]